MRENNNFLSFQDANIPLSADQPTSCPICNLIYDSANTLQVHIFSSAHLERARETLRQQGVEESARSPPAPNTKNVTQSMTHKSMQKGGQKKAEVPNTAAMLQQMMAGM